VTREIAVMTILYYVIQSLQPILVPLCFIVAWVFLLSLGWSMVSAIRDLLDRSKRMHEIPCANCQFFTNNYRLKCTVQPTLANTEQAIGCRDYRPKQNPFSIQ
jgi:hypothetical protein